MESSQVSDFRDYILRGDWSNAEAALMHLGVTEEDGLWVLFYAFLVSSDEFVHSFEFRRPSFS